MHPLNEITEPQTSLTSIATWNVNSLKVRLDHVLSWLAANPVDVLCLQELKQTSDAFPRSAFMAMGYDALVLGQKTYNGVAILYKKHLPCSDVVINLPGFSDEQQRVLTATIAGHRVICAYVVNGEALDSPKYLYKLNWLDAMHQHLMKQIRTYTHCIVLGDFNIVPTDLDWPTSNADQQGVFASPPERAFVQSMLDVGLYDAFRLFYPNERVYTWWDYRQMSFRRNIGLRIDHIYMSEAVRALASDCLIDRTPRAWERPSDHAPVILHLNSK
jgi:exodeoxyribonuclease-3